MPSVAIGAGDEVPMAAVASAGPARPDFAIFEPCSAVAIEALSPAC